MIASSLCERCERMREIISGKGSRFLLCQHALVAPEFPKYPAQPVLRCRAFVEKKPDEGTGNPKRV